MPKGTVDTYYLRLRARSEEATDVYFRTRRLSRARRLRLTLDFNGVFILTLPRTCPLSEGVRFIRQQADWIRLQTRNLRQIPSLFEFLRRRPWVAHNGIKLPIYFYLESEKVQCLDRSSGRHPYLAFCLPGSATDDRDLLRLFRHWTRYSLAIRTAALAFRAGLNYRALSVRDQASRWGSCSSQRNLSLNWRLALLEPELQDYVILHELSHLRVMNHSEAFWTFLESVCPDARKLDRRLARIGSEYRILSVGRKEAN